jgi:superfamily II DNA or RNA helicase
MLLNNDISKKLLNFQIAHVYQLQECLQLRNRVIDASDTGSGKTYCAIAICALLKLTPFIICPKSVISNWSNVCNEFGIKYLGISNYEMLKNCNYYTENYEKVKCPYMDIEIIEIDVKLEKEDDKKEKEIDACELLDNSKNKNLSLTNSFGQDLSTPLKLKKEPEMNKYIKKKKHGYKFYLPKDTLVIFDEAHRCKNWSSQTSNLLVAISKCDCKIMILSATLTDKIDCFKPFGIVLDFYKVLEEYKPWIKSKELINKIKYKEWTEEKKRLDIIHNAIFPQYGSRMKIKELGNLFPSNNITANCYFLEDHLKVEELYKEINAEIENIKKLEDKSKALGIIIRNRMRIEMLKVTLFMDLAQEGIDSGYSVVIFVNYISTLEYLCYHLKVDCIIKGGQTMEERDNMIKDFQSNKKKVIIVMQQAGGVGISLHDIHGGHQRMSIISPSWSGQEMRQTLGRIHRAGSKTPAIQKIIYVAKTYEEQLCNIIKIKLRNIDALNDGDLTDYNLNEIYYEEDKNNVKDNKNIDIKPKKKYIKKNSVI